MDDEELSEDLELLEYFAARHGNSFTEDDLKYLHGLPQEIHGAFTTLVVHGVDPSKLLESIREAHVQNGGSWPGKYLKGAPG